MEVEKTHSYRVKLLLSPYVCCFGHIHEEKYVYNSSVMLACNE